MSCPRAQRHAQHSQRLVPTSSQLQVAHATTAPRRRTIQADLVPEPFISAMINFLPKRTIIIKMDQVKKADFGLLLEVAYFTLTYIAGNFFI